MNIHHYLDRIGYTGSTAPTTENLFALQRAHLLSVPFENLDIHLRRQIRLDEEHLFEKIVNQRRGGICYELNGLFAFLLRAIGYEVFLLNARGLQDDGSYGPEFDHLVLQVYTIEDATPWLVDVGWGSGPLHPLNMDDHGIQEEEKRLFQLHQNGEYFELVESQVGQAWWVRHYAFTRKPHALEDFNDCCRHHQTSPDSIFTQTRICSLFLADGHITLTDTPSSGRRLIETRNGNRQEKPIEGESEFRQLTAEVFHLNLEPKFVDR